MHVKPKLKPIKIQSINGDQGNPINDLEAAILCFQKMIRKEHKAGKKGIVLFKGTNSEYKMSYKKLQALLFQLSSLFGIKGAFSYGICYDCKNFDNSKSSDGCFGTCRGQEKCIFDSCNQHEGVDGFGL